MSDRSRLVDVRWRTEQAAGGDVAEINDTKRFTHWYQHHWWRADTRGDDKHSNERNDDED